MTKPASLSNELLCTSRQALLDDLRRRASLFITSSYWHQAFVVLALIREAIGDMDEIAAEPNHSLLFGELLDARANGGATDRDEACRPSIALLTVLVETLEAMSGTRIRPPLSTTTAPSCGTPGR